MNTVAFSVGDAMLRAYGLLKGQAGKKAERRNGAVLESQLPVTITLLNAGTAQPLPLVPGRKANPWASLAELPWLLAGRNDVAFLLPYLPRAADFADDGLHWPGGYGPRLAPWLHSIVRQLAGDPETRRACIPLLLPQDCARVSRTKDFPCTTALTFWHPNPGVLDLHVTMRSNDLVWGYSGANAPNWVGLLRLVAELTGSAPGRYHHTATNLHAYERHWAMLSGLNRWQRATTRGMETVPVSGVTPRWVRGRVGVADLQAECERAVEDVRDLHTGLAYDSPYLEAWSFFMGLSRPLTDPAWVGNHWHEALACLEGVDVPSWRTAALLYWLDRPAFLKALPATGPTDLEQLVHDAAQQVLLPLLVCEENERSDIITGLAEHARLTLQNNR